MTPFRTLMLAICLTGTVGIFATAQDAPAGDLSTDKQKASYSVGLQLGNMVATTPELIDQEALVQGLRDAIDGNEPKLSDEEMTRVVQDLQVKMQAAARKRMEEASAESKIAGEKYLEQNAQAAGWKTTSSGLQYKVVTPGTGKTPVKTDTVQTHYRGTFIDGNEFDSSYKRGEPATFGVTQVIPGWTEALLLMKEGAKWELAIPYQLAYGEAGRPPAIPPYSVLRFEIELLDIVEKP